METYSYHATYRYGDSLSRLAEKTVNQKLTNEWAKLVQQYLEEKQDIRRTDLNTLRRQQEILEGLYGEAAQADYRAFSQEQQIALARSVLKQEKQGDSITLFSQVMTSIMQKGVIYQNRFQKREILYHIGCERNQEDEKLIQWIQDFFLPFSYHLRLYWDKSFVVFDEEQCEYIDSMVLY